MPIQGHKYLYIYCLSAARFGLSWPSPFLDIGRRHSKFLRLFEMNSGGVFVWFNVCTFLINLRLS